MSQEKQDLLDLLVDALGELVLARQGRPGGRKLSGDERSDSRGDDAAGTESPSPPSGPSVACNTPSTSLT